MRHSRFIDGQALVSLDGHEQAVEAGDLIMVAPWVKHRLRTDSRVGGYAWDEEDTQADAWEDTGDE